MGSVPFFLFPILLIPFKNGLKRQLLFLPTVDMICLPSFLVHPQNLQS